MLNGLVSYEENVPSSSLRTRISGWLMRWYLLSNILMEFISNSAVIKYPIVLLFVLLT